MVFIERLYGDWNDEDITKSWTTQSTIDCCKIVSHDIQSPKCNNLINKYKSTLINNNRCIINNNSNIINNNRCIINNNSNIINNNRCIINNNSNIINNKKLNCEINNNESYINGYYFRRNENFDKKFKIKYKGKYKN
jgi:hypothetical protein